jgi:hypothetical protein
LVGAVAAAGEADVGLACFAGAVDDAADDRHGERRRDVREALLEPLDRLDDLGRRTGRRCRTKQKDVCRSTRALP